MAERFDAYGWHTDNIGEVANDTDALEAALRRAMAVEDKPSMILLRSHIGWPSPHKTDTAEAHGSPLGEEEIRETKAILGLPPDEQFWVPDEVVDYYRRCIVRGQAETGGRGRPASTPGTATRRCGRRARAGAGSRAGPRSFPVFEAGTERRHPGGASTSASPPPPT